MSRPSNASLAAIPFPPPRGPFPMEVAEQIAAIKGEVDRENAKDRGNFDAVCTNWIMTNVRNEDFGVPITPKPPAFYPQVVKVAADTEPSSGVTWLWIEQGIPVTCPDLPQPVVAQPDFIHIGTHIYGNFWSVAADNTFAEENKEVPGVSSDPSPITATWKFIQSEAGRGKGWYVKVGQ